jgi:hypothetical protein
MEHTYLASLEDKMKFTSVYLVTDVVVRETKGVPPRPYWDVELRDSSGMKWGRVWAPRSKEADEARTWMTLRASDYIVAEAHTESYQGEVRLVVDTFRLAEKNEIDPGHFIKTSERLESDIKTLDDYLAFITEKTLQTIAQAVLGGSGRYREAFLDAPGAENGPYNVRGGALMQTIDTVSAVSAFIGLASQDGRLQQLTILSTLLANTGKIWSYKFDTGVSKMTTEGRLFGEPSLSARVIEKCFEDKDARAALDYSLYVRLIHAVSASRWQGNGLPQSYEAVVVRHAYELTDSASHVANVVSSSRGESIGGADFTPFDGMTKRCYLRSLPPE